MANQITVNSGTGNITVTTSRAVIGTVANVASANYANYANVANTANTAIALDADIANVSISGGTNGYVLQTDGAGNLSWTAQSGGGGNGTPGGSNTEVQFNDAGVFGGNANLTFNKTTGTLTANKIAGNGAGLTSITGANVTGFVPNAVHANSATVASSANSVAGANVTGTVANATFATTAGSANTANSATVANSANSVAVANVTGIGNIATVNLDGNASNVLRGNGTFGPETASGNANYANFAGTAFSVSGSNVSGAVANATFATTAGTANSATVAASANSVAGANVSGTVGNANIANNVSTLVDFGNTNPQFITYVGANTSSNQKVKVDLSLAYIPNNNILSTNANGGFDGKLLGANTANPTSYVHVIGANGNIISNINGTTRLTVHSTGANINGNITANNLGNIASINLDGSSSNVLYGNGVFAPAGGSGANANYANFAGDVVNSTQSNITSIGNLVSLQVGNGSANTATTTFTPVGANITTLAGDIFVNNKRVSYDDADVLANGQSTQDAIIMPNDTGNGISQDYVVNYLVQDLANTSNIATLGTDLIGITTQYDAGNAAAPSQRFMTFYNSDSDLATANPNTTLDVTYGGAGLFINRKMPNDLGAPVQTGIIGMMNYGEVSDPSSATGIAFQRRRGNNSGGSSTRDPVVAGDYLGNINWRGAGTATGTVNSQRAVIGARVDSSYGGPGNVMPIGMELVVVDNSNVQLTHSFYANGDVSFAGNVTGNISTTRISNGTSNVRVSTSNGPVRIATNGTTWVEYSTNRNLTLSGVEADYANATTLNLRNGGINVLQEDLQGGFPSFAFSSYYPNTGFIAPYTFYRARGNVSSPAGVQSGDAVMNQSYYVYGDSGNTYINIGSQNATVVANDNAGNIQSSIQLSTARDDNGSRVELISDIVNLNGNSAINLNANTVQQSNTLFQFSGYTATALTAITGAVGQVAAVTDNGGKLAYWDTTNSRWSYVHDNSAV